MNPSEVCRRIFEDHEEFRGLLLSIEALGRQVLEGDESRVRALRLEGETFHEKLLEHMRWEDVHFAPLLRRTEAWGEERAALLDRDHLEQRELLLHTLSRLRDPRHPSIPLARNMVDLVALLRDDMKQEDAILNDARLFQEEIQNDAVNQLETG